MIFRNRFLIVSLLAIAMTILATACTGDDDNRDPDAPSGTGSGTPVADFGTPTPEDGETDEGPDTVQEPDSSVVPQETGEPVGDDDGTPGTSGLPTPGAVETEVSVGERTVTPDSEAVGPQGEQEFPDIRSNVPELDNFTLTITGEISIVDEQNDSPASVDLNYQQSAPNTFHLYFDGDDDQVVEVWNIDEQMWIRQDGEVTEATEELSEGFDIASYLGMLPDLSTISNAEPTGEEEVQGRATNHYVIEAEDAIRSLPSMQNAEVNDAEGSIELWVDAEEEQVIRMVVDLQWTDANDSENYMDLEYQVTEIGETEEIQLPEE